MPSRPSSAPCSASRPRSTYSETRRPSFNPRVARTVGCTATIGRVREGSMVRRAPPGSALSRPFRKWGEAKRALVTPGARFTPPHFYPMSESINSTRPHQAGLPPTSTEPPPTSTEPPPRQSSQRSPFRWLEGPVSNCGRPARPLRWLEGPIANWGPARPKAVPESIHPSQSSQRGSPVSWRVRPRGR